MKKINWAFMLLMLTTMFSILFFVGCGCKEETVRYSLNSFEKSIIPYNETKLLEYKDANGDIIAATAMKKEVLEINLNSSDDEGCFNNIVESQSFDLSFNNSNKLLYVKIAKSYNNRTTFDISESDTLQKDMLGIYLIKNLDTQDLEQNLSNVSIDGFQFNNVFVFEVNPINIESEFETIVFSPKEGIVFLKKRAGGYLKIN